jgi:hypothetical protein
MGDFDVNWDVRGIDKTMKALTRGLEKGLDDTGETLLREGREKAVDEVIGYRRIWNQEVIQSFKTEEDDSIAMMRSYVWGGRIFNTARHADVVDRGLAPAGEIEGSSPSVQDILPWVVDNLTPRNSDANLDNWSEDLQNLAGEYSPGYVMAAFAVRDSIEDEGYPGIHFTETTESYLKQIGTPMVKAKIKKHMRKELRKV